MSLSPAPTDTQIAEGSGPLKRTWQAWLASVQYWLGPMGAAGTTALRPTKSLFVGYPYFDTTLGYMVWIKQVSPSVVWVNGSGTPV